MGSLVSKPMSAAMERQQEIMAQNQLLMMERQIQMNNLMREKQVAMQLARSREMFYWLGSFYGVYLMTAVVVAKKSKAVLAPVLPLTFLVGYQFDLSFGNKLERIREEADRILDHDTQLLALPHGIPTVAVIDSNRFKLKSQEKLSSPLTPFK